MKVNSLIPVSSVGLVNQQIETVSSISASDQVINQLLQKSADDKDFTEQLLASLQKAKDNARRHLGSGLFEVLQWPLTMKEYESYLISFSKWMPKEVTADIWKIPGITSHQEVDDRLGHFYWLINQKRDGDNSIIVQNTPWFKYWLIDYTKVWGSYLNSTESFNKETMNSFFNNSPKYRVQDSMIDGEPNNPSGWLTFNQFFARELNSGLRPITCPYDNKIVTTPADCTFRAQYNIGADSSIPEITVKHTHRFSNIEHLLGGSEYKSAFAQGTFVHYYLSPFSYHRFHAPVSGKVKECYPVHGLVNLDVVIKNEQFDYSEKAEDGYQFTQARGVMIIDTTDSPYGNIGIVAIIPIGMCQVTSVKMTATVGSKTLKGDEFGYFLFGGSDIIVLFQEGVNPDTDMNDYYRHYGNKMAECVLLE